MLGNMLLQKSRYYQLIRTFRFGCSSRRERGAKRDVQAGTLSEHHSEQRRNAPNMEVIT